MRVVETAAALLVGTAAAITPSIALAPTASADCPDIEVIFARGTDDTPGFGAVGGAFVSALKNRVGGRSVGSYAVAYPADYDFLAAADGASLWQGYSRFGWPSAPMFRKGGRAASRPG